MERRIAALALLHVPDTKGRDPVADDPDARDARDLCAGAVLQRFWYDLASMPGWRPRLRYALVHLFPGRDYMRQRYPLRHPRLWPLTYPYRWLHGLFQALSKSDLTDFPKSVRS